MLLEQECVFAFRGKNWWMALLCGQPPLPADHVCKVPCPLLIFHCNDDNSNWMPLAFHVNMFVLILKGQDTQTDKWRSVSGYFVQVMSRLLSVLFYSHIEYVVWALSSKRLWNSVYWTYIITLQVDKIDNPVNVSNKQFGEIYATVTWFHGLLFRR